MVESQHTSFFFLSPESNDLSLFFLNHGLKNDKNKLLYDCIKIKLEKY